MTTNFRLYESAWVLVEGLEAPVQVHKDPGKPGAFRVGEHLYDIDARAMTAGSPKLLSILSLQAMSGAGLLGRSNTMAAKEPPHSSGKLRWSFLPSR
ncbi:hypothetical protein ABI_45800 [Asticcacaulis biprosthecium C19]|uniref:Uncharacterized protein n=1 Tax=Asticcacaulis biprosthecium C19 TaxID=715226 RepID=F4QTT3_9CAUL|nr:hypothetical protein [Asticcacaulis biprosthecium]EGF89233.1 hypothetical protein ABI_45800 [Asticcacaulis biprosthecium C19]